MDAIKFIKEKTRMCESFGTTCIGCPLYSVCKKGYLSRTKYECWMFIITHAEQAVAIVEKWSNEHPIMTNKMKFEEVFGKTCDESGVLARPSWWEAEYKEPKGEE